jgi:hypothetical protein
MACDDHWGGCNTGAANHSATADPRSKRPDIATAPPPTASAPMIGGIR